MIIYNVTIKVNNEIHLDWVLWMQQVHIPELMNTKCFTKYVFAKLLEIDDADGPTYSCQYYADSLSNYNNYIDTFSNKLRQDSFDKWGENFIAFRTLMQIVN